MVDKKISELPTITQADIASGDWIPVVDSSTNTTKKYNFGDTKVDVTAFINSTDSYTAGTIVGTLAEGFAYKAVDTATTSTVANAGGQNFEELGPVFSSIASMRNQEGNFSDGQTVRTLRGGEYTWDESAGILRNVSADSGRKYTDWLLGSMDIKGLYLTDRSGDLGVGVSFGGDKKGLVEYRFEQDSNGWWRGAGAISGYSDRDYFQKTPSLDGTFVLSTTSGATYTTTVGDRFWFSFKGESLYFRSYTDDRGGLWRFWIDGQPYDISVYSASVNTQSQLVVDGLGSEETRVGYAEFMGDDPANAPSGGAGTARGWIYYIDTTTASYPNTRRALFGAAEDTVSFLNAVQTQKDIISRNSINEFAMRVLTDGSSELPSWVPSHSPKTITNDLETKIYANGQEIDPATYTGVKRIRSFVIEQSFSFTQENETTILGRLTSRHRIDQSGKLVFEYKITATVGFDITTWYPAQIAAEDTAANTLVLDNGSRIDLTSLTADEAQNLRDFNVSSAAFIGGMDATTFCGMAIDVNLNDMQLRNHTPQQDSRPMLLLNKDAGSYNKLYWRGTEGSMRLNAGDVFQTRIEIACVSGVQSPNNLLSGDGKSLI